MLEPTVMHDDGNPIPIPAEMWLIPELIPIPESESCITAYKSPAKAIGMGVKG